jgi:hypothetical protein
MHQDIHAAAYLLNPKYHQLLDSVLSIPREATSEEKKCHKRVKDELLRGLKNVLLKLAENPADADAALNDFHTIYRLKQGSFDTPMFLNACLADNRAPHEIWVQYGESCEVLQPLAMKILSAFAMTSPCERSWSAHGLIHTKLRNGLTVSKLEKLVHVSTNLKEMARPKFLSESEYNWVGAEECDDSDGEEIDPLAIEGMVDEDGEVDPLALQDMDASCLDSTANQWADFLADVDIEDEEEEY